MTEKYDDFPTEFHLIRRQHGPAWIVPISKIGELSEHCYESIIQVIPGSELHGGEQIVVTIRPTGLNYGKWTHKIKLGVTAETGFSAGTLLHELTHAGMNRAILAGTIDGDADQHHEMYNGLLKKIMWKYFKQWPFEFLFWFRGFRAR